MKSELYFQPGRLYRANTVCEGLTISRSALYNGVRDGRYPPPVRLGARTTVWRGEDLLAIIAHGPGGHKIQRVSDDQC